MTTGELLVELSGLPTGTAIVHLMAIEAGGGGPGGTTIIDSFSAVLEGDVEVLLADDTIDVVVENEMTGEVDQSGITGIVSGDIDVDLECS